MSTRRSNRTLDERVADLEEHSRRSSADAAVSPTDVRFLYSAKGDILVAFTMDTPQAVSVGADGKVLTADSLADEGVSWQDPDRVRQSTFSALGELLVGFGAGQYVKMSPGPDGAVLTADSTSPTGLRWV